MGPSPGALATAEWLNVSAWWVNSPTIVSRCMARGYAALEEITDDNSAQIPSGTRGQDVLDTAMMRNPYPDEPNWPPVGWDTPYKRPGYPTTWAHRYGQGRVFFTALGHSEETWRSPLFQEILFGGVHVTIRDVEGAAGRVGRQGVARGVDVSLAQLALILFRANE